MATVFVALAGATWLLLVAGVSMAAGVGNDTDHSPAVVAASALAQAPAVWSGRCRCACFAWRSQWATLGWAAVVLFATLGQIGALLNLPTWVVDLSPYAHAPRMPVEAFEPVPALVLTGITLVLLGGALLRYRSRDIG